MSRKELFLCSVRNENWEMAYSLLANASYELGKEVSSGILAAWKGKSLFLLLRVGFGVVLLSADDYLAILEHIDMQGLGECFRLGQRDAARNSTGAGGEL